VALAISTVGPCPGPGLTLRGEAEAASSSGQTTAGEVNYERVGEGVSIWTARDGRVFTSQAEYVAYERSLFRQSRTLALPAAEEAATGETSAAQFQRRRFWNQSTTFLRVQSLSAKRPHRSQSTR
jgi:hypothetical protein